LITDEEVAVMYARANPVPSLDLLDPFDPVDIDHLIAESERSSNNMSEIRTIEPKLEPARSRPVAGVAAVVALVVAGIVVVIALANRQPEVVDTTPQGIAEAFMAALNDHDADALVSLLADDVVIEFGPDTVEGYRPQIEQWQALGWTWEDVACAEAPPTDTQPPVVRCAYAFSNDLTRAVGVGPYGNNAYRLTIDAGKIQEVNGAETDDPFQAEALGVFFDWVAENHPEDAETMHFNYTDEDNLAKWKQYLPEFVADMEASG
jgi:hypothetical protein